MTTYWPNSLVPQSVMFRLKPMNSRGPRSFSGKSQVVGEDAGFWVATLSNFIVRNPSQIMEWRAVVADLEGGLNDLIIGPFDCRQTPRYNGIPPIVGGIPHSDGSPFSDGSTYEQSSIVVKTATAAELRATTLDLTISQAGALKRGMYFTIWTLVGLVMIPRLYMIVKHPVIEENRATIRFLPPLRVDVPADTEVDFADPKAIMNLADDDQGALDIRLRRRADPSLELEESWNGLS